MAKPRIKTPVLEYWGFKQHPFDDYILRGKSLSLFANRGDELHRLRNSLSNRLTGVYGSRGVGKSSFLRKFEEMLEKEDLAVAYVHLTGTSANALYREILAVILRCNIKGSIKTNKKLKLDSKKELDRVEFSISLTQEWDFGANTVLRAGMKKLTEKQADPHTEESARALIRNIITNTRAAFVVIVDDLERMNEVFQMKHVPDSDEAYFRFVSAFARTVDESFSDEGVAFVVSLDEHFVRRIAQETLDSQGAISFSFGELVELGSFRPKELLDVIRIRLKGRKWPRALKDFISLDAFWALLTVTGGHARRTLAALRAAMEYVEMNKRHKRLDVECIRSGLISRSERIDEKDLAIVEFLSTSGPHSPSDDELIKAINITRKPLSKRLKVLTSRLGLQITQEASGKTIKDLYSLPEIQFRD